MRSEKTKFGKVTATLCKTKSLLSTLINRSVTDERGASKSNILANRSIKRSQDVQKENTAYQEELKDIHAANVKLREAMSLLNDLIEESEKMMADMKVGVPIKVIDKKRIGNKGRPTWPIYIWELILKQLVNGTPPSSINANIVDHVKKFLTSTKIKELPSICTIRQARTVILVVVQTLAAYRI